MKKKALFSFCALLATVLALLITTMWSSDRTGARPVESQPAEEANAPGELMSSKSSDALAGVSERREPVASEAVPDSSGAASTPVATEITVRGSVVVLDEHGVEHAEEDGNLWIQTWLDKGDRFLEVAIARGSWEVSVPSDAELRVGDLRLGGRAALLVDPEPNSILATPVDHFIELRARWLMGTLV